MTANTRLKSQLQAEYQEALKKEKAKLADKKEALMKAAASQSKLIEKQAEMAIVKIIRRGIFNRFQLTGMPPVDEVVRLENKAIDARLHVIVERVQAGDKLGAMRALKVELDAGIERIQKAEKRREDIERKIAERDVKGKQEG